MNIIAILDVETTGTDPEKDSLAEVAIARFDVKAGKFIDATSRIVCFGDTNEAEAVNGIPVSLGTYGKSLEEATTWVLRSTFPADAIVAHYAEFDSQWFPETETPWICSCDDIEWPRPSSSKSLLALAVAHGVAVASAHRALTDVLTLVHMFERVHEMGHDLEAMLTRAMRPKALFQAMVSYDDRERAKEAGFRWEGERKRWVRKVFLDDVAALGFAVREVTS